MTGDTNGEASVEQCSQSSPSY